MVTEYEFNIRKEIELAELRGDIEVLITRLDVYNSNFFSILEDLKDLYKEYRDSKEQTYRDAIMDDQFNSRKD